MLIDKQPKNILEDVSSLIKVFGALATSPKWYQVRAVIRSSVGGTIESIVCLAIGRLHNTDINDVDEQQPNLQVTFQIALLLLLCNEFQIPVENRIIYDPRHTKEDNFLWKMLGLTPQNFNAKDPVTSNILFYMPFCPWGVTEDIVASNWTQLERISILGNSLSSHIHQVLLKRVLNNNNPPQHVHLMLNKQKVDARKLFVGKVTMKHGCLVRRVKGSRNIIGFYHCQFSNVGRRRCNKKMDAIQTISSK